MPHQTPRTALMATMALFAIVTVTHAATLVDGDRFPTPLAVATGKPVGPFGDPAPLITRLQLDEMALEVLRGLEVVRIADFPIDATRTVDLDLHPVEAFTTDARIVSVRTDGSGRLVEVPLARPDVVLLGGTVADRPGSSAYLALSRHGCNGWIELDDRRYVLSQGPRDGGLGPVIYDLASLPPGTIEWAPFECETETLLGGSEKGTSTGTARSVGIDCRAIRHAIETDYEFTGDLFGGDVEASAAYVATLMGAVTMIYERDVETSMPVVWLRLWETPDDPWDAGSSGDQLYQFRDYWYAKMGSVDRDLAHMLSGRGLGGGVAWVGVVCSYSYGYALSGNLGGYFPYPPQNNHPQNWDLMVVAHEAGHNCGTSHTHNYCPPLDQCAPEGYWGSCQNETVCTDQGTIMSYCHLCDGGLANVRMEFHPTVEEQIEWWLDTQPSCDIGGSDTASAGSDNAAALTGFPVDIDVLLNDVGSYCAELAIIDFDETTAHGGTVELVGDDIGLPMLRYTSATVFTGNDVFQYTIQDANDQQDSANVVVAVVAARVPENPGNTSPGVAVAYYDLDDPQSLPDFDTLTQYLEQVVLNVDYPSTNGDFAGSGLSDDVGAVFSGYVTVPETAWYTLYVESDDGSRFWIGDTLVVDNDGLHGMLERGGVIALQAGTHATAIEFFERGGGAGVIARIEGGGLAKQVIPPSMWFWGTPCAADVNSDGTVDVADLLSVIAAWGQSGVPEDIDGDGTVAVGDVLELIAAWGPCR